MYSTLYVISSLAFAASVAAYIVSCTQLSKDIAAGRIPLKAEEKK